MSLPALGARVRLNNEAASSGTVVGHAVYTTSTYFPVERLESGLLVKLDEGGYLEGKSAMYIAIVLAHPDSIEVIS